MAYQNFYATKLQNAVGSSDTTITVQTPPTAASGRLVLEPRNAQTREIVSYTGVSGNDLTGVTRGLYGTSAQPHSSGALLEMNLLAQDIQDVYDAFGTLVANNNNGWVSLATTPTLSATNGNRSFDIAIPGDKTALLSKGMRLKIPRTTTAPTQSADFNGTSQYASKTSPSGITFTDDFTCEAWIWLDSISGTGGANAILARRNTSGWQFRIADNTGQVQLFGFSATGYRAVVSNASVPFGRWVHIAATLNMSANTGDIYMDGVQVSSTMNNSGTPTSLVQAGDLAIGLESASVRYFDGKVADARLWSTIRTQSEIRDNMNKQLTGSESGLVGYWKLNGNFNDSTSNANNLSASGGATATYAANPFNANAYAIVMSDPVYSAPNTTMTVQCPTGYPIPNETLGTISYATVEAPYGFPLGRYLWELTMLQIGTGSSVSNSAGTYVPSGYSLVVPTGEWQLSFSGTAAWNGSSTSYAFNLATLSTSTSSNTLPDMATMGSAGSLAVTAWRDYLTNTTSVVNTTAQTYYWLITNHRAGNVSLATEDGSANKILALPAGL